MRPSPSKAGAAAKATAPVHPLAAAVDELGALEKEFAAHQFKAKRIEELRASIRAHYGDKPALDAYEAKGSHFTVLIGPRATERRVNVSKLAKRIPYKTFASLAAVTLRALASLDPRVTAEIIESAPTGSRTLTVLELGPPHVA